MLRILQVRIVPLFAPALRSKWARPIATFLAFLLAAPVPAHAQSGSPFDTGFTAIQNLFTGTIAKVASLVAIGSAAMASLTANREQRNAPERQTSSPHHITVEMLIL